MPVENFAYLSGLNGHPSSQPLAEKHWQQSLRSKSASPPQAAPTALEALMEGLAPLPPAVRPGITATGSTTGRASPAVPSRKSKSGSAGSKWPGFEDGTALGTGTGFGAIAGESGHRALRAQRAARGELQHRGPDKRPGNRSSGGTPAAGKSTDCSTGRIAGGRVRHDGMPPLRLDGVTACRHNSGVHG